MSQQQMRMEPDFDLLNTLLVIYISELSECTSIMCILCFDKLLIFSMVTYYTLFQQVHTAMGVPTPMMIQSLFSFLNILPMSYESLCIIRIYTRIERGCLSHDQDTIHAAKRCAEMFDFCITALMFFTSHGIQARTQAHTKITHLVYHQNLEMTLPAASCFQGPDDAHHWEMCNFRMGMGSCYIISFGLLKSPVAWQQLKRSIILYPR